MDTEQEQIFDEIDDINFNSALENLETLIKDASQKDNYACYLMVEMFIEKQHARIKKLKEINKKLVEQLEKIWNIIMLLQINLMKLRYVQLFKI